MAEVTSTPVPLYTTALKIAETSWVKSLAVACRSHGYTSAHEPACGPLQLAIAAKSGGFPPAAIHVSDVSFVSTVIGHVLTGTSLEGLGACVCGELIHLTGNLLDDAARLILEHTKARIGQKEFFYWEEMVKDLTLREVSHLERFKATLVRLHALMGGANWRMRCMQEHFAEVRSDPHALVLVSPPSSRLVSEKLYQTGDLFSWKEPTYSIWEPKHEDVLLSDARNWAALLVCFHEGKVGEGKDGTVYARALLRAKNMTAWSNRPDEVERLIGRAAVPLSFVEPQPANYPVFAPDGEVKPDSRIDVVPLTRSEAKWYKELWIHRISPKKARSDWGVLIDGKLAGIAGYDADPILAIRLKNTTGEYGDALLYTYGTACPHNSLRLTRLVTMLALCRCTVDQFLSPWLAIQARRLLTAEFTDKHEAKGSRGLMELISRVPVPTGGHKLLYMAEFVERTYTETLAEWLKMEAAWQQTKANGGQQKGRRGRRSGMGSGMSGSTPEPLSEGP